MKKRSFLTILLGVAWGFIQHLAAQTNQSAVYDATTILNLEHGLNALVIPVPPNYTFINPKTGLDTTVRKGNAVPPAVLNNADDAHDLLYSILKRNASLPDTASDYKVDSIYSGNPFLKDILHATPVADTVFTKLSATSFSNLSGAAGTTLFGNIANGTADFLIKRAEDELAVAIFSKLQAFLARYPEFATLFPQTCALVAKVEAYNFSNILSALESAIQADLKGFVGKIPSLYGLPKYQTLNKKFPPLTLVFSASTIISDIDSKDNIATTMADLGTQTYLKNEQNNYSSIIRLACLLSNGIRNVYTGMPNDPTTVSYITSSDYKGIVPAKLADQEEFARYFLGLIYQQAAGIQISMGTKQTTVQELIHQWQNKDSAVVNRILAMGTQLKSVDSLLTALKSKDEGAANLNPAATKHDQRYLLYAQLAGEVLNMTAPFVNGANPGSPYALLLTELQSYWNPLTTNAVNMLNAFDLKQYDLAMQDLSQFLGTLAQFLDNVEANKTQSSALQTTVKSGLTDALNATSTIIGAVTNTYDSLKIVYDSLSRPGSGFSTVVVQNLQSTLQMLKDSLNTLQTTKSGLSTQAADIEKTIYCLSDILKYAGVLASISQAQNSAEVENLLESTALPAGSSRIKKVTDFNIAVNAYVGGFGRSGSVGSGFTNRYGFTAPIGFTFSHGFDECGSVSFFAGVFDIGNIIQYKLNNEGTYEQNISLAGIVSPSLQLAYGLPWYLPISIGAGCQWTSPVTNTTNDIRLTGHFNAFIGVDIPLFNLCVVKKKVASK
jgi:hypothetical protein